MMHGNSNIKTFLKLSPPGTISPCCSGTKER